MVNKIKSYNATINYLLIYANHENNTNKTNTKDESTIS